MATFIVIGQGGGLDVRFWLYQKPDGKIATLFDACEICGPVGFYKNARGRFARIVRHPSTRNRSECRAAATQFHYQQK